MRIGAADGPKVWLPAAAFAKPATTRTESTVNDDLAPPPFPRAKSTKSEAQAATSSHSNVATILP